MEVLGKQILASVRCDCGRHRPSFTSNRQNDGFYAVMLELIISSEFGVV